MAIVCNCPLPGTQLLSRTRRFQSNDIFYICDTINPAEVEDFITRLGEPAFVVGDNAGFVRYPGQKIYTVPFVSLELEWQCLRKQFTLSRPSSTDWCFNFIINKKQINRHLLIKLIEYLGIDNKKFVYTWSGVDRNFDLTNTIREIDQDALGWPQDFKAKILSPIEIPVRWIEHPTQKHAPKMAYVDYGGNSWTWINILQDLMSRSAVSLVSESQQEQLSCVFTEKTLYAVMGFTFPIWIGGVGHADYFQSMGFDIFADVIDHSYQWQPTLIRRCYHALVDNLAIISDLDYARHMRFKHIDRLLSNVHMLTHMEILKMHTDRVTHGWPDGLHGPITELWARRRSNCQ